MNQLAGYLLTEDPTYISNRGSARARVAKLDQDELLADIVSQFLS